MRRWRRDGRHVSNFDGREGSPIIPLTEKKVGEKDEERGGGNESRLI